MLSDAFSSFFDDIDKKEKEKKKEELDRLSQFSPLKLGEKVRDFTPKSFECADSSILQKLFLSLIPYQRLTIPGRWYREIAFALRAIRKDMKLSSNFKYKVHTKGEVILFIQVWRVKE